MDASFVVDNSVVMTWCFADEADAYADGVLDALGGTAALVPAIWTLELVNVLLMAERRQRLRQGQSMRFLALVRRLPILVDRSWTERLMGDWLALGRERGLSSSGTAYLELAIRQGLPLATLDDDLRGAAEAVGVPLFQP